MSLINPQLRCTEEGLLVFDSYDFESSNGDRSRDDWLRLASDFLPLVAEDNGEVKTLTVNLRDSAFQEAITIKPGIPFKVGLLTKIVGTLIKQEVSINEDPVLKLRSFCDQSMFGDVHMQMQRFLCAGGVNTDVARSVIDVMSLAHGQEINEKSKSKIETIDDFYRGGYFSLRVDKQEFRVGDEENGVRSFVWPIINLETLGDSTTYGYVGSPKIWLDDDKLSGRSPLYAQSYSNIDHALHALPLALGVARLADAAANYTGEIDIFSPEFIVED